MLTPEAPRQEFSSEKQPSSSDFVYYYLESRNNPFALPVRRAIVKPAMDETTERFGVQFRPLRWGQTPPKIPGREEYYLVNLGDPRYSSAEQLEYLHDLRDRSVGCRVNVIPAFRDIVHGDVPGIQDIDEQYGINTIYPDNYYKGARMRSITARDAADNIVCETFRCKYVAEKDASWQARKALNEKQIVHAEEIDALSGVYAAYGLWHRAPTDGALIIRDGDNFLATQTRTDKTAMGGSNFSLITGYSEKDNTIAYSGLRMPTSDAPELLNILAAFPQARMAVHFHKNRITRGSMFADHKTSRVTEYGVFESAQHIIEEFKRIGDPWIILKEHGLVWLGNSVEEFEAFVNQTLGLQLYEDEQAKIVEELRYIPNKDTMDSLRLDTSLLTPASNERIKQHTQMIGQTIVDKYAAFIPDESKTIVDNIGERLLVLSQQAFVGMEQEWKKGASPAVEEDQPESDIHIGIEGRAFRFGRLSTIRDPETVWNSYDEDLQHLWYILFHDQTREKVPTLVKNLHVFETITEETVHQFQDWSLPGEFLECAAPYYTEAILKKLGLATTPTHRKDRSTFYAQLVAKFGEQVHRLFFDGSSIHMTDQLKILSEFTDEVKDQLFPNRKIK